MIIVLEWAAPSAASAMMADFTNIGAAVIGTGFIGGVHAGALRRLGVEVRGVLGSSAERGRERAGAMGVKRAYASLGELLADPEVQVVHVTSPNNAHYEQVKAIVAAGRHVVCEKPLALDSIQSAAMAALAEDTDRICAVCYNIRFYPLNQHAHRMATGGELGDVRLVSGHYMQDWLAKDTDWNWRLEREAGGTLRSVGDIGTHWVDLVSFITGMRVSSVFAELETFIEERHKPAGPVETFAAAGSSKTEPRRIDTDDAGLILLRFASGARGSVTISQVSPGRKNAVYWDIAGSAASASWHSETPDHLWIGHRDRPNEILQRDAALMNGTGAAAAYLPGGHVEGFGDTFHALFAQVYADISAGARSPRSTYASFEEGHYEMLFCDAVLKSSREGRWINVEDS